MFETDFTYAPDPQREIPLDKPMAAKNGQSIETLKLREPTSNEVWVAEQHLTIRNAARGTRLYQKALLAKITGIDEAALENLPVSVFTRAARYLQSFVEAGLPEGEPATEPPPPQFRIIFEPPSEKVTILTLCEPTLGQMAKAETALGDMSPQRVRTFQEQLVAAASGEAAGVISGLPISVLNRAASYAMGFTSAGQVMQTS